MRKIKFRGKTLDGRWIYGDLWHRPYAKDCVTIVSFMEDTGTTGGLEVIPETVGQYTGIKDKNGEKIYEGDIVENTTQTVYLGDKYEVVWNKNYAGYQLMSNGFTSNIPLIQNFMSYEVIGNIFENRELLSEYEIKYCPKCGRKIEEIIVPAMTADEENLLREVAAWFPHWKVLKFYQSNITAISAWLTEPYPFDTKRSNSKAYTVLTPILEKYGEIDLDDYR